MSILEKTSVEHREAHVAKINDREARADARVRQRLAERRAKRERADQRGKVSVMPVDSADSSGGNKARSAKANSSATATAAAAEMVRKRVRAKVDTPKKLAAVFGKLDMNHNSMLSKAEFGTLVGAVLKPERPSQEVLSGAWDAA